MRKIFILLFAVLVSCNQTSNDDVLSEASTEVEATQTTVATQDETTTTVVEVSQLDPFRDRTYTIIKEESRASYLAPKQFLNSGLVILKIKMQTLYLEFQSKTQMTKLQQKFTI